LKISIIIPIYNELENLQLLNEALHSALDDPTIEWEAILVDDGSSDASPDILRGLAEKDPIHLRVIELRRNYGQTAAIAAGIDHSSGDIIILMDADLQNDPADIPLLVEKINEGYDVVSGWRVNRQDKFLSRVLPSKMANSLISRVTGVHLHDYGCTLKAYRREVLTGFRLYGEMHRFIPAYAKIQGAKITELQVTHHPRRFGKTKYGLNRTIKVVLDLLTVKFLMSYSSKPIYLFGGTGMVLMASSMAVLLFLLVRRLWIGTSVLSSPLFTASLMFLVLGFQSVLMGLIAELLVRTYYESQDKPTYTVRQKTNLPE
jgi:glycosyltransferase involved in cell wall biosynthesis